MPLTVSEIAQRLIDAPEHQAVLVERIRHWTREGLIKPIGEKNPGTGRHRKYEHTVLVDVAVLNALAGLGIQVGMQLRLVQLVRGLIEEGIIERWLNENGGVVYLEISNPGVDSGAIRNLHARVERRKGELLHFLKFEPSFGDATILINLSRIVQKIGIQNTTGDILRSETVKG